MRKKALVLAVLTAVATLTLSACGGGSMNHDGMSGGDSSSTVSRGATGQFNDADVEFATSMIPHHRQAIEMATLADTRASAPEVKALAAQIKDAQDPEIETMTGWLTEWGEPIPADHGGMDMSGSMPGMMSMDDMDALEAASGAEFDQMFLTMMIEHHRGAIEMAKTEQADGESEAAVELAADIETAQTAEITTMKALLS